MQSVYWNNPITTFCRCLLESLDSYKNEGFIDQEYKLDDPVLSLLLRNNGVEIAEPAYYAAFTIDDINYRLIFIVNAQANPATRYYDYINFMGMRHLIIFMDYFEHFFDPIPENVDENNIVDNSAVFLGRGTWFDALVDITNRFIETSDPVKPPSNTMQHSTNFYNSLIIPAYIIESLCDGGFQERDIGNPDRYQEIKGIADDIVAGRTELNLALAGIRNKFEE